MQSANVISFDLRVAQGECTRLGLIEIDEDTLLGERIALACAESLYQTWITPEKTSNLVLSASDDWLDWVDELQGTEAAEAAHTWQLALVESLRRP